LGGVGDEAYVPSGLFVMGCSAAEGEDCEDRTDELPRRMVALQAFAIDRHEVSVMAYKLCVSKGGCSLPAISNGMGANYAPVAKQTHPINFVTWDQAVDYCEWQDKRLCSEAEWEMAGRGSCSDSCAPGDIACCESLMPVYPWGDWAPTCSDANHGAMQCVGGTTSVGTYPNGESPYGALDMSGNVWEWVQDCWHPDYTGAPVNGDPWVEDFGMCVSHERVIRGGSYDYNAEAIRTAERFAADPAFGSDNLGFRCCRDLVD